MHFASRHSRQLISLLIITITVHLSNFPSLLCFADVSLSQKARETCPASDPDCNMPKEHFELTQIEGFKTGFVQHVTIEGTSYKLITRSMKPLLFEIPHFLTEDECDHIMDLAKEKGLKESLTSNTLTDDPVSTNETINDDDDSVSSESEDQCKELMENYDKDSNGKVSAKELTSFFEMYSTSQLKEEDIRFMLLKLGFDKNKDGELSFKECLKTDVSAVEEYIDNREESNPLYKTRYSQQAWLSSYDDSDPVLSKLQQRIIKLTKLPPEMIENSEDLQVVKYSEYGHFHAHYDSTFKRGHPCCRNNDEPGAPCNLCRFATILYYLNNVTEGGETAFPLADNATYDQEEYQSKGLDNLSTRCYEANVVVKPSKGTAILWYNHHINQSTGGIGVMDKYSLHGGCDVKKGIKWIANNWLNTLYMPDKQT